MSARRTVSPTEAQARVDWVTMPAAVRHSYEEYAEKNMISLAEAIRLGMRTFTRVRPVARSRGSVRVTLHVDPSEYTEFIGAVKEGDTTRGAALERALEFLP